MKRPAPVKTAAVKMVKLSELRPHPRNPRRHDRGEIDALKASMLQYGFTEPLIRQQSSGFIVAGAGRLQAAGELAEEGKLAAVEFTPGVKLNGCLPVVDKALTDRQALAYCIADNRITERGTWDYVVVKDILVTDLGLTADVASFDLPVGFDAPELQSLEAWSGKGDALKVRTGKPGLTDDDAVPETAPSRTKPGDVWLCGRHRILCGDSTKPEDVKRLMAGGKAETTISDPPYGIGYDYLSHDDSSNPANLKLVRAAFALAPDARVWTCGLRNLARDLEWNPGAKVLCWHKAFAAAGSGLGGASTWEPVLVHGVKGGTLPDDYLRFQTDREPGLREKHSCPKPVALYVHLIDHLAGANVYDPFLGSGTTLIACEKLGRVCMGMEIEPKYVSVAVKRWEDFTGLRAVKEGKRA